jgi:DMSO reductase anchor subunit
MHPAPSVIFFTSFSGLGFGMLMWLGSGLPLLWGLEAFVYFFVAYALSVGGLLSSVFHLGNPKNGLKAFSQWRTSWLSREGICAVLSLLVMGLYGIGLIFLEENWFLLGYVGSVLSFGTVFTTSMIYMQLKTVPRWNMLWTPVLFMVLSWGGGALLVGDENLSLFLLLLGGCVQVVAWLRGDKRFSEVGVSLESATGLGSRGRVRMFESPHTGTNYLLKEMVYKVGRKHARKLRVMGLLLLSVFPVLLLWFLGEYDWVVWFSVILHVLGLLTVRWLFFAEAEHVVGVYYGKR